MGSVGLGLLAAMGASAATLVSGIAQLAVFAFGFTELILGAVVLLLSLLVFVLLLLRRQGAVMRALRESTERSELLGLASNELVWDWQPKGDLFWWNDAYVRTLGLPPGTQPSFDTWKRHISPRDRERVLLDLNRSIEGVCTQWRSEYAFPRKDGSEGVFLTQAHIQRDAKGTALRVVGSMMDISERRRLEWERTRLAVAFSQSTELVAVLGIDGKIAYVNPAFKGVTGMDIMEASGRSYDFMRRQGRNAVPFAEVASRVASAGSWSRRMECSRRGEGGDFTLHVTITAIHGSSSYAEGYLLVGRDVTRELLGEEQARLSQKMEAVGRLASGVVHDLNNVLQVVNGYVQILGEPGLGAEEHKEAVDEIASAAQRASRLIRLLQLFSRRQTMEEEHFDLARLAADMLALLRGQAPEGVSIELQHKPGACGVHADRSQVELVLMNLFLNARDAMPAGGRITISTGPVHLSESACEELPWARPGDFALLEVVDTGCGMDRETLARIFEPFFSTKPKGKGIGLGLPIVYGILQRHRGLLHVTSEPGLGTCFQVYFPLVDLGGAQVPMAVPESEGHVTVSGSGLILVAEDDADIRALVTRTLERSGFEVLCAENGEEAVRLFLENRASIRLAILDGAMPKLSGQEVHARIVKERPELPVIRCSGYASGVGQSESMQTPLCQTIEKPYDYELLLKKIALMLAESGS
jgi:PAS domain S-box-containing protein